MTCYSISDRVKAYQGFSQVCFGCSGDVIPVMLEQIENKKGRKIRYKLPPAHSYQFCEGILYFSSLYLYNYFSLRTWPMRMATGRASDENNCRKKEENKISYCQTTFKPSRIILINSLFTLSPLCFFNDKLMQLIILSSHAMFL